MAVFGQTSHGQLGGPGTVSVSEATLPAKGQNHVVFEVDRPWRVSAQVTSPMGTALRVVDRIEGPGPWSGEPGEADGRVDLLLDKGSYKVDLHSPDAGTDSLSLKVFPFKEVGEERIQELDGGTTRSSTLQDLEQRSFWFTAGSGGSVRMEAAGRALTDLKIWRDGTWLVDIESTERIIEPGMGKPMTRFLLAGRVEAGEYLVTAYGGDPLPWAYEPDSSPFHIRFGVEELPEFFSSHRAASPFGTDYVRVPGTTNTFMLFLDEKKDFELKVGPFRRDSTREEYQAWGRIDKESVEPECLVKYQGQRETPSLVAVTGSPGEKYRVLGLKADRSNVFHFSRRAGVTYWFSTLHAGRLVDAIDATGIVVRSGKKVHKAMVISLGKGHGWKRTFNLLEKTNLYVEILEAGRYEIRSTGVNVRVKMEPFFVSPPKHYRTPKLQETPSTWDLEKGMHVVTFEPMLEGMIEITIRHEKDDIDDLLLSPKRVSFNAGLYTMYPGEPSYALHTNRQPGVIKGLFRRESPVDLSIPFMCELSSGEEISFPFKSEFECVLRCTAARDREIALLVDGERVTPESAVPAGTHTLKMQNLSDRYAMVTLVAERYAEPFVGPPWEPPLPERRDQPLLVLLHEDDPLFFDFEKNQSHSVLLQVASPGSYTIESLGLLKTRCSLRTRTKIGLLSDCRSGPGRNCLLSSFLGEGLYLVTAHVQDRSEGRGGLLLRPGGIILGDTLQTGTSQAVHVPAGQSLVNWFSVDTAGVYRIATVGESRQFLARFEDSDGWPLVRTGSQSSLDLELDPGTYSITTYPSDVEGSRITTFDLMKKYVPIRGKGPHRLALGKKEWNRWMEPSEGETRKRDIYLFDMPGSSETTISLSSSMRGYLFRDDGDSAIVTMRKRWEGELATGSYRLEVESRTVSNLQEYTIQVSCRDLVAGTSRAVTVPAELSLSVGKEGMIAIRAAGSDDVKATLFSDDGAVIQESDDCVADWNFHICSMLEAGAYRLKVAPVGKATGRTVVSMEAMEESWLDTVVFPSLLDLTLKGNVMVLPLSLPLEEPLLAVRIKGSDLTGYSLLDVGTEESVLAEGRDFETRLLVSSPLSRHCLLRVWSWGQGSGNVKVELGLPPVETVDLRKLEKGVKIRPIRTAGMWLAPLHVETGEPSTYRIETSMRGSLLYAVQPGTRLQPSPEGETEVSFSEDGFFLATETAGSGKVRIKGRRLVLDEGEGWTALIRGNEPVFLDFKELKNRVAIAVARSRDTQPGVCFSGRDTIDRIPLYLEDQISVAVFRHGKRPTVRLWNANRVEHNSPVEMTVTHHAVNHDSDPPALGFGTHQGILGPGLSRNWALPSGRKLVRIGGSARILSVLLGSDTMESMLLSPSRPSHEISTQAEELLLYSLAEDGESAFSVEILRDQGGDPTILAGNGLLHEELAFHPGTTWVPLANLRRGTHLSTTADEPRRCRWIDGQGIINPGWDHVVDKPGGYLEIDHGRGLVKAWAWTGGDSLEARWGPRESKKPVPIYESSVLSLEGNQGRWVLWGDEPFAISLLTDGGVCATVRHQGKVVALGEGGDGVSLSRWFPGGEYEVLVRGLGGRPLAGSLILTRDRAEQIAEAFGPWVLLKPGESRYFSFSVKESGKIGLGVQGKRDGARCEILTPEGVTLADGVRLVEELSKGSYLIRIYLPMDEDVVAARAVVAGLIPPGTGPPDEYIRRLMSKGGFVQEGS